MNLRRLTAVIKESMAHRCWPKRNPARRAASDRRFVLNETVKVSIGGKCPAVVPSGRVTPTTPPVKPGGA